MKSKFDGKSGRTGGKKRLSARRRWEESLIRNNAAAPLGVVIRDLIAEMGVGTRLAEQSAVTIWDQAVGETISREAQPKSIKQGVLKVKVKDAAWRQELSFMKEDIIGKMNHVLGREIVSDIIFS